MRPAASILLAASFVICHFEIGSTFKLFSSGLGQLRIHKWLGTACVSIAISITDRVDAMLIASEGAPPKLSFFQSEDSTSVGAVLYDVTEKEIIKVKVQRTSSLFETMREKFEKAVTSNPPKRTDAQAILSNYMGTLKNDIRSISKVACGGDIVKRGESEGISGTKEAYFDYNSGKFALKPIAQDAEAVIEQINDIYFNTLPKGTADDILGEFDSVKSNFNDWLRLVEKTLS